MKTPSAAVGFFGALVLCISSAGVTPSWAQAPEPPPAVENTTAQELRALESRGFADHLFNEGEYYRAIGEYQRYLFLHPNAPDVEVIRLRSAMAYLFGGEYVLANDALGRVGSSIKDPDRLRLAAFGRCQASYLSGRQRPASAHLQKFLRDFPSPGVDQDPQGRTLTNHALLMAGWTSLRLNRLEEAEASFTKLSETANPKKGYADLVSEVRSLRTAPQTKSPWVAGLLSVVPGLGHTYIERYDIAAFALVWNSLFIYAAADNIAGGNYGTGTILIPFAFLWYSGTVYGAVNGAHKWNRDMRLNKLDELEQRYPPDPGLRFTREQLQPATTRR